MENTSDESVGAEKLLSWALKDDLASQGGHLAIAARIVVTASQFPDARSGSVRLPAAKAFAGAPPGALRAALIAAKHETASICELCASAACGDAKGVDGRYPAATRAASFVAGRGDEDSGWAPQKTAKKGNEVWASACRTAILRAIVDDDHAEPRVLDQLALRAVHDARIGYDGARIALGVREARPEVAADVKCSQKIRRCRVGMRLTVCDEGVL